MPYTDLVNKDRRDTEELLARTLDNAKRFQHEHGISIRVHRFSNASTESTRSNWHDATADLTRWQRFKACIKNFFNALLQKICCCTSQVDDSPPNSPLESLSENRESDSDLFKRPPSANRSVSVGRLGKEEVERSHPILPSRKNSCAQQALDQQSEANPVIGGSNRENTPTPNEAVDAKNTQVAKHSADGSIGSDEPALDNTATSKPSSPRNDVPSSANGQSTVRSEQDSAHQSEPSHASGKRKTPSQISQDELDGVQQIRGSVAESLAGYAVSMLKDLEESDRELEESDGIARFGKDDDLSEDEDDNTLQLAHKAKSDNGEAKSNLTATVPSERQPELDDNELGNSDLDDLVGMNANFDKSKSSLKQSGVLRQTRHTNANGSDSDGAETDAEFDNDASNQTLHENAQQAPSKNSLPSEDTTTLVSQQGSQKSGKAQTLNDALDEPPLKAPTALPPPPNPIPPNEEIVVPFRSAGLISSEEMAPPSVLGAHPDQVNQTVNLLVPEQDIQTKQVIYPEVQYTTLGSSGNALTDFERLKRHDNHAQITISLEALNNALVKNELGFPDTENSMRASEFKLLPSTQQISLWTNFSKSKVDEHGKATSIPSGPDYVPFEGSEPDKRWYYSQRSLTAGFSNHNDNKCTLETSDIPPLDKTEKFGAALMGGVKKLGVHIPYIVEQTNGTTFISLSALSLKKNNVLLVEVLEDGVKFTKYMPKKVEQEKKRIAKEKKAKEKTANKKAKAKQSLFRFKSRNRN